MNGTLGSHCRRTVAYAGALILVGLMASPASASDALYQSHQATGLARAFCPEGMPVMGGGGFIETLGPFKELALRQVYPISHPSGVIAFGTRAIGYQVASSNFQDITVAFAICGQPPLTTALSVRYVFGAGIGVARAFCPTRSIVTGGGAFVEALPLRSEKSLRQSHPISDTTGTIAFGTTAIGWQGASSDFSGFVMTFAVCATPAAAAPPLTAQYVSAQSVGVGVARAFCPAGTTVTGGGGFVEQPADGFKVEKLRQSLPISDETGVIAFGNTAIGWQTASSDFSDTVVAFAICGSR